MYRQRGRIKSIAPLNPATSGNSNENFNSETDLKNIRNIRI